LERRTLRRRVGRELERAEAAKQFEELLAARRAWIKLSSLGMWYGMLVIEMSWADRCNPIARSEILYAGFMKMISDDPALRLKVYGHGASRVYASTGVKLGIVTEAELRDFVASGARAHPANPEERMPQGLDGLSHSPPLAP
jgi:hypothetical protein